MKDRIRKRLIATLVCVNIIINSIPVTFASETDVVQEESGTGITEVVSLREENVKHFDLGNGVYQAVIYDSAVHRLDSNGDWQEINNNLYLNNARSNQTYSGSNDRINFASSLSVNESIFELSENNYSVSMSLTADVMPLNAGTASVDAVVTNTSESRAVSNYFDSIEEAVQENNVTTVLYEEILNHTDLKYVLSGNDIKEYIIVKEKSESYSYRFELNMEGLYAELTADGSVWLLDTITKEKQYIIPAPFMYDANNVPSLDVEYSLTKSGENTYLTVTADADWINAEERVFPVTIDPTITTDSAIADTYVSSANPTVNYGSSSRMWVSDDRSATWGDTVTYMRFSLPDIPYGSLITSANVNAYYWYFDKITSGHITVGAYQMLYSWTESGLTWNIVNELDNLGTASSALGTAYAEGSIGATYSAPKKMSIPITSLVDSWYSGTGNYGVAFKFLAGDNYSVIFNSSESSGDSVPTVSINYIAPNHTHQYVSSGGASTAHPHEIVSICECGDQRVTYQLMVLCSTCRADEKIATETIVEPKVFMYADGDAGFGAPIFATIDCCVTYTNYYDYPISMTYDYPPFATFLSIVESSAASSVYPGLDCVSDQTVTYYTSSGEVLWAQDMQWNTDSNSIPIHTNLVYTLDEKPAYTVTGATFTMPQTGYYHHIEVTTYFE